MATTDNDLFIRSQQNHRVHLAIAGSVVVLGVVMFLTIALAPLGLAVFFIGLAWLGVAILMGRVNRLKETEHSPHEER